MKKKQQTKEEETRAQSSSFHPGSRNADPNEHTKELFQ